MNIIQPIMYFLPGHDTPEFIEEGIHYYQDRFSERDKRIVSKLMNCQSDFDINHLMWKVILEDECAPWNLIDTFCQLLLKDAQSYPGRPGKRLPNYNVIHHYVYERYQQFKGTSKPVQGRKHTKGYSYRNHGKKGTGERYYAMMADDRYYKSIGEPTFRKRGGNLLDNNSWGYWEYEGRSQVGTWKAQGKYRHQWEAKVRRDEKRKVSNTKRSS